MVLIAVEVPAGRAPNREQTAIVTFVQRAAVRAVNFGQGDAAGLTASRGDFTDDAWKDFINHMQGFLDEKGAPTFTSSFVVSGPAKVLDERNGTVRFIIPGTLTQSSKLGKTTYRAVLEVSAGGEPLKIQKVDRSRAPPHRLCASDLTIRPAMNRPVCIIAERCPRKS